MKRLLSIFLVTAFMLSLVAPMAVAKDTVQPFADLDMSVLVPDGWESVQRNINTVRNVNADYIHLNEKNDAAIQIDILVDNMQNAAGEPLTLEQVGNLWCTRQGGTEDERSEHKFSYHFINGENTINVDLRDHDADHRVKTGKYLGYFYSSKVDNEVVDKIFSSITIGGVGGGGSVTGGGGDGSIGSSGGGGCVAGSSALAMLGALVVFMKARKR